jgi:hypothetical protein
MMVCLPATVTAFGISRRTASCFIGFAGTSIHSSAMASAKKAVRLFTTFRHVKGASLPPRVTLRVRLPSSSFSHRVVILPSSRTLRTHWRSTAGPRRAMGASATSG